MSFKKILVAIDNSPLCPAAFAATLELARSNQALVKLMHCITPDLIADPMMGTVTLDAALPPGMLMNDFQTQQVLIKRQTEDAQALLTRYAQAATQQGVVTESDCLIGEAGYQLCEMARSWVADLVVVGRRGRTGLAEAFLGSVSNYVVHHAPCSVLVIQDTAHHADASSQELG
jgi:nucleotide-binding universal stress UspA family protein